MYSFDDEISSFEEARNVVYPTVPRLDFEGEGEDDYAQYINAEDDWIEIFIKAANVEYTEADGPTEPRSEDEELIHAHLLKQQSTYNHKPYEKTSQRFYTNDFVNIRMRFLFRAILTYHQGGPAVYPTGGNNGGYPEDKKLPMSERLSLVADVLRQDKRVLMDVIEGRGVLALAASPNSYSDRKAGNKRCNERKKRKFDIADQVEKGVPASEIAGRDNGEQEADEEAPTPSTSRGKGKRKAGLQGGRGGARKRRNTTTTTTTPVQSEQAEPTEPEYQAPVANMTYPVFHDDFDADGGAVGDLSTADFHELFGDG